MRVLLVSLLVVISLLPSESAIKTTTAPPSVTSKLMTTTKLTTVSNKKPTTKSIETVQPPPAECLSATNLTDSWRMDHDGKDLKGGGPNAQYGRACDFRKSLQWFRFTGAAGKNTTYRLNAY